MRVLAIENLLFVSRLYRDQALPAGVAAYLLPGTSTRLAKLLIAGINNVRALLSLRLMHRRTQHAAQPH